PFEIDIKNFLNPWLYSYGAGMRTVIFGYYMKFDLAWPVQNFEVGRPQFLLTLGFDLCFFLAFILRSFADSLTFADCKSSYSIMIKSMTGFGQVTTDNSKLKISVEVKSLNSKFLDLGLRLPKTFSDKELELRNLVSEKLERGKVTLTVEVERYNEAEVKQTYNEVLFAAYYNALKKLA